MSRKPLGNLTQGAVQPVQHASDRHGTLHGGSETRGTDEPVSRVPTVRDPGYAPSSNTKGAKNIAPKIVLKAPKSVTKERGVGVLNASANASSGNGSGDGHSSGDAVDDSVDARKRGFGDISPHELEEATEDTEDINEREQVRAESETGSPPKRVKSSEINGASTGKKSVITMGSTEPGKRSASTQQGMLENGEARFESVANEVQNAQQADLHRGPIEADLLLASLDNLRPHIQEKENMKTSISKDVDVDSSDSTVMNAFLDVERKVASVSNENFRLRSYELITNDLKDALRDYPENLRKLQELQNLLKNLVFVNCTKNVTIAAQQAEIKSLKMQIPNNGRKKTQRVEDYASLMSNDIIGALRISVLENNVVKDIIELLLATNEKDRFRDSVVRTLVCQLREERLQNDKQKSELQKLASEIRKLKADKCQSMYEMASMIPLLATSPDPKQGGGMAKSIYASPNKTRGSAMAEIARRKTIDKQNKN